MLERAARVVSAIKFPGLEIILGHSVASKNVFLRVFCPKGTCNDTGRQISWKGRHWRLSQHMTDGEIVQTAFLAIMTALEHEAREQFTYKGARVFSPHLDINRWAEYLLGHSEMEQERQHG